MRATTDFLNYSISLVSSEDANYPASNLKIYTSSTRSFRSLDTSELTITLNLQSAKLDPRVLLYNVNFDSVKFQGNDTDSWGSPSYDPGLQTIERDPDHFIYKLGIQLAGFNHQYLRIVIPNQATTDGAAHFEIGLLGLFDIVQDFSVAGEGFGLPVDQGVTIAETVNKSETGRKDIMNLSDIPVITFGISGTIKASVDIRKKIADVFNNPIKSLVYMERNDENSFQVYLIQRVGSMSITESVPGNNGVRRNSISFETIL